MRLNVLWRLQKLQLHLSLPFYCPNIRVQLNNIIIVVSYFNWDSNRSLLSCILSFFIGTINGMNLMV